MELRAPQNSEICSGKFKKNTLESFGFLKKYHFSSYVYATTRHPRSQSASGEVDTGAPLAYTPCSLQFSSDFLQGGSLKFCFFLEYVENFFVTILISEENLLVNSYFLFFFSWSAKSSFKQPITFL